ncbi:Major Facilitator Superfamily Domain-Containing Protein 12 [Manis pentadactyla]|nr:Major Facilitator Superfamily Domain-Containing Protein 12 [Manis pentadactyla]
MGVTVFPEKSNKKPLLLPFKRMPEKCLWWPPAMRTPESFQVGICHVPQTADGC